MTHLERFWSALYLSEGWYVWYRERSDKPAGRRNYARARAVVLFDRCLNYDIIEECEAYPKGNIDAACICGSWPGGKCLKCERTFI